MTLSRTQKIAVLSVMAVAAVGFLAFSIAGLGKEVVTRMSAAPRDPVDDKANSELPLELLGEPFSHPVLARAAEEAATSSPGGTASSNPMPPTLPGGLSGFTGLAPFNVGLAPQTGDEPPENAGLNRNIDEGRRLSVALSAIVKVNRAVALLSVNKGESRAYRAGDLVCPGLRLVAIGQGAVTLRTAQKTFELRVGGEAKP